MQKIKFPLVIICFLFILNSCASSDTNLGSDLKAEIETQSLQNSNSNLDYDLTTLSSAMIYAQVYEMMNNPTNYLEKTFKINGYHERTIIENREEETSFIIIADALACCATGIEMKFDDGIEIPEISQTIVVEAVFTSELKNGQHYYYLQVEKLEIEE